MPILRRHFVFFYLGFLVDRTSEFLLPEVRALFAFDVLGEVARFKSRWESLNRTSVSLLLTYRNAVIQLL